LAGWEAAKMGGEGADLAGRIILVGIFASFWAQKEGIN